MTDLAALVVRMQADNSQYIKALDQATGKLSKFAKDQEDAFSQLKDQFAELGAQFAAGFALDKIIEFTASSIESAAALDRLSQTTGISTESLSTLRLAAAASGLSADDMGVAYKKLNVSLEEAAGNSTSKAGIAFKGLGISVTDSSGKIKDAGSILGELAGKFQNMEDGPNKVALAVALLGKQGQNLIPVLNQGSAGLDDFKKQAEDAGLVISGDLARSAEEFSQKAAVLKASLVDGLSVRLATQLLPVLEGLAGSFGKAGGAGDALNIVSEAIVIGVKSLASVFVIGASELEKFGNALGAVGAAAAAVAHGNFVDAKNIILDGLNQNEEINQVSQARLKALWTTAAKDELDIISATEVEKLRLKLPGFNLAEGEASAAADKKLKALSDSLKEQEQAFGLGGAAAVQYKLSIGSLAEDLKIAGKDGHDAAAAAIEYANALQTKKDDKTVQDYTAKVAEQIITFHQGGLAAEEYKLSTGSIGGALKRLGVTGDEARQTITNLSLELIKAKDEAALQALDDQADKLAGNLNKAALAAFDLQNKSLKQNLTDTGDAAGLAKLDHARDLVDVQSKINKLNLTAAQINAEVGDQQAKIDLERSAGQITDIDAMNQLAVLRAKQITDLGAVYTAEQGIAATVNDPAMTDGVKKFGVQINALKTQMNAFDAQIRTGLEGAFAHNFSDLITGAKSFKQVVVGFLQDIDKQFVDMIAKNYSQQLFAAPGANGSGGGLLGGVAGLLGGLMGGGGAATSIASTGAAAAGTDTGALADTIMPFASGGTLDAGKVGLVGEAGPELVYSGSQNMNVLPSGAGGKQQHITQNFTIQAPGGTISRASQMQTAAAAARSLAQANRRNNA
jgi:hypothetical protein